MREEDRTADSRVVYHIARLAHEVYRLRLNVVNMFAKEVDQIKDEMSLEDFMVGLTKEERRATRPKRKKPKQDGLTSEQKWLAWASLSQRN